MCRCPGCASRWGGSRVKRALAILLCVVVLLAVGAYAAARSREHEFARLYPPPGKRVGPPGSQLHYIERGSGEPAVVMLHGDPGLCLDFERLSAFLSPKHRALAFDRPGYGWSERPQASMTPVDQARLIHAALEELRVERPILVGFSFGGITSLAYAIEYPQELRGLVLVAPVADPVDGHPPTGAQRLMATPGLGPLFAWTVGTTLAPPAIESGFAEAFSSNPVDPGALADGRVHFRRPSELLASANDWVTLEGAFPAIAARYKEIRVPVELIQAGDDKIVGPAHGQAVLAALPGVVFSTVPHAGHLIPYTHPDLIAEAVERVSVRYQRTRRAGGSEEGLY
jgi:pimeloyl-ACP methyl ester carboxylesterase